MKNRPRLKDVARLAGVSTATVSAVVTNSVGTNIRVSPDTQQRVWEAVAQLGYIANPAARSLAGGKNRILGIFTYEPIFPFQHHDFFYPFLVGIEKEAEKLGYHLLLFTSGYELDGRRSIYHDDTNMLYMADGSILLGLNDNKEELRRLQAEGYPFVYIGRREVPGTEINYVGCDYARITTEMTCRLAALGHQRLVFVGVTERREGSMDREKGFFEGCRQHGLDPANLAVLRVPASSITPTWMQDLLQRGFTGALIEMDDQGYAAYYALQALKLSVPRDFSVALLGEPHSVWENPQDWTMFTMPRIEMGARATQLLIQRMAQTGEEMLEKILLPATLVAGQTIAPPAHR